jgi:hypothetical protein
VSHIQEARACFLHAGVHVDFQRDVPASVSCCLGRNPQCSSCSCPRSGFPWASCQVLPPQSADQIYGSTGRGHRGILCQLQYGHHASVFPSWWAVVFAQDRVNETSGNDCFCRTHETTQWDIRVPFNEKYGNTFVLRDVKFPLRFWLWLNPGIWCPVYW